MDLIAWGQYDATDIYSDVTGIPDLLEKQLYEVRLNYGSLRKHRK